MPENPIPEAILQRLVAFLESGQSGRIWFDIRGPGPGRGRGRIIEAEFPERVRAGTVVESRQ